MPEKIENGWNKIIQTEKQKDYFKKLVAILKCEFKNHVIYPAKEKIFAAFKLTKIENCKVVIVGQDPYHEPNQAMGLAFSVPKNSTKLPPSLKNILKEVENNTKTTKKNPDLTSWATQGVLLINSILTVRAHQPQSHSDIGWQQFTDRIIYELNNKKNPIVFMLWGRFAEKKQKLIKNPNHKILIAPHPSPLSANRGYFGCNHFNLANEFLVQTHQKPINWSI